MCLALRPRRPAPTPVPLSEALEEEAVHVRVWTYRVAPGCEAEFARTYGAEGAWVALFRQAPGFLGTELLRPPEVGGAWMTLDRWASAAAFVAFQATHAAAYAELDAACDVLTVDEQLVGVFEA